ncbi:putative cyclic phosphodiesterase, 2',3'-cyclic-nucleotide 3'-phosphodiesterase [Helianthus annuus]|nr:putative cyclic phosphodiesterase, 2',3'-cyclic-nucleotide 3'-phosphodiesterase [Helianthus annuus]
MYFSSRSRLILIRFLSLLGILGLSLFLLSISMDVQVSQQPKKDVYSVWALPPEHVSERVKKLMVALRSEFGGPEFEPHVTVVGAIRLTEDDARDKLNKASEGLKAYNATVEKVATGTFFYQCVFLLLHPTTQVTDLFFN